MSNWSQRCRMSARDKLIGAMNVIYESNSRVCGSCGSASFHIEKDAVQPWIEIRSSGTGGPRSGEVITRYENGVWGSDLPANLAEAAQAAVDYLES